MKLRNALLSLSTALLIGSAVGIAGCAGNPAGIANQGTVPEAGTAITADLWNSYQVKPQAGMKFSYEGYGEVPSEVDSSDYPIPVSYDVEIVKVEDGVATIRTTENGKDPVEATAEYLFPYGSTWSSLKFEKTEDVTIPAGTFKGALKFVGTVSNDRVTSQASVWLHSEVGFLKSEQVITFADSSSKIVLGVHLKSYSK